MVVLAKTLLNILTFIMFLSTLTNTALIQLKTYETGVYCHTH